jgi:hypothetical protein
MVGTFYNLPTETSEWVFISSNNEIVLYHDYNIRKDDYTILESRLKKLFSDTPIYDIDFSCLNNTRPLDLIEGNGDIEFSFI